jgi:hypothetical protein
MALSQFTFSSADVRRVNRMQFGVLSPEEVVSRALVRARSRAVGRTRDKQPTGLHRFPMHPVRPVRAVV